MLISDKEKLKIATEALRWISLGPYYGESAQETVISMMKDAQEALNKIDGHEK